MKIYGASLLALCALHSASGFVVQAPKASGTQLASSLDRSPDTRVVDKSRDGPRSRGGEMSSRSEKSVKNDARSRRAFDTFAPTVVQGGSLETWSFPDPRIDRVQVRLETEGRPLNANVELWQGPDNSPQKMGVYIEDARMRPFNCVIATPRGSNAIAIRNTAQLEFPLIAGVEPDNGSAGLWDFRGPSDRGLYRTVQGGAVHTMPFAPGVESVQILLKTDGRPLNARIELLQGPNNNKQVIELYTEDGLERPFLAVIETPEVGNVIRIVNTATVEFPLTACMEPYSVAPGYDPSNLYGYEDRSMSQGNRGGGMNFQGRPSW